MPENGDHRSYKHARGAEITEQLATSATFTGAKSTGIIGLSPLGQLWLFIILVIYFITIYVHRIKCCHFCPSFMRRVFYSSRRAFGYTASCSGEIYVFSPPSQIKRL